MECFDISHTQGDQTVASRVVFVDGAANKADYRRFNISGITPGDDYAAMRQALDRRYRRVLTGEGRLPDILLIDGGLGQLAVAGEIMAELGVEGVLLLGVARAGPASWHGAALVVGAQYPSYTACRLAGPAPGAADP